MYETNVELLYHTLIDNHAVKMWGMGWGPCKNANHYILECSYYIEQRIDLVYLNVESYNVNNELFE